MTEPSKQCRCRSCLRGQTVDTGIGPIAIEDALPTNMENPMSIRTIVEFNHDFLRRLRDQPELLGLIVDEIATSQHAAKLNEANERGRALDIGHGVRIVMQRHHSTEVSVKTEYGELRL